MCCPEGTVGFIFRSEFLFARDVPTLLVFETVAGAHYFRVERDSDFHMHFFHASPGTGTRVATVDVASLAPADALWFGFVWSPEETRLHVGNADRKGQLLQGTGIASRRRFQVGSDGTVHRLGDQSLEVTGATVKVDGRTIIQPTAIEAWNNTLNAIRLLGSGTSSEGFLYEVVVTNVSISMLVTGYEAYYRSRFLELEAECLPPNFDALVDKFLSREEREASQKKLIEDEATRVGISPIRLLIEVRRRINFQNYKESRIAFARGYGIRFGVDLGVANEVLGQMQKVFDYRHRVIHRSPLLSIVNEDRVPAEAPIFADGNYRREAVAVFQEFVNALHGATLRLRRTIPPLTGAGKPAAGEASTDVERASG